MPEICPFLAASHDPDSVLNYPSAANVCTKLGDPQPVATDHQAGYCLRARHWFCPVYTGALKQPPIPIQVEPDAAPTVARPPRDSRTARERLRRQRERRLLIGLLIVVLGGGAVYGGARVFSPKVSPASTTLTVAITLTTAPSATVPTATAPSAADNTSPTVSPPPTLTETLTSTMTTTPTASPSPTSSATATPTVTSSLTSTSTPIPSATATPKVCEVPFGWQRYTVSAGETYFHIAVKFGTSVDALQRVNCLAAPEHLLAGQVIFVPPVPTTTPPH